MPSDIQSRVFNLCPSFSEPHWTGAMHRTKKTPIQDWPNTETKFHWEQVSEFEVGLQRDNPPFRLKLWLLRNYKLSRTDVRLKDHKLW